MFQNFLLRKMLRSQGIPEDQIEMFLNMIEKNPELFKSIAKDVEEKVKQGLDQQTASIATMKKYEVELKKLT